MKRNRLFYINYKNIVFKASFFVIILVGLFSVSTSVSAATNAIQIQFKPQIGIPNSEFQVGTGVAIGTEVTKNGTTTSRSDLMARYVSAFYNWGMTIVGVIAVLMLMAAGLLWLTSGGDSERINQAKKLIGNSLLGSGLLIGSWFLLNTINPNLTSLPVIETIVIQNIKQDSLICCDATEGETKLPVHIINGKKMAANGKNVIISCKAPAVECAAGKSCTKNNADGLFSCNKTGVCGENGICIAGSCAKTPGYFYETKNSYGIACPKDQECCTAYKKEKASCGVADMKAVCLKASSCPDGYSLESSGSDTNKCDTDLRCCRPDGLQVNQSCGKLPKAICKANVSIFSCGDGWSHDGSPGKNCGSGLWCCYPN